MFHCCTIIGRMLSWITSFSPLNYPTLSLNAILSTIKSLLVLYLQLYKVWYRSQKVLKLLWISHATFIASCSRIKSSKLGKRINELCNIYFGNSTNSLHFQVCHLLADSKPEINPYRQLLPLATRHSVPLDPRSL